MFEILAIKVLLAGLVDFGPQSAPAESILHAVAEKTLGSPGTAWHCCLEFYSVATRLPPEFRLTPEDANELLRQEVFGRLVVQGGLTTGLLHALVATDLPGPGTVFLSQNWKFTAPVFIGDTITAEAEILSVHASKPVTQLDIKVTRQDGETVLEGEAWCYTFTPTT